MPRNSPVLNGLFGHQPGSTHFERRCLEHRTRPIHRLRSRDVVQDHRVLVRLVCESARTAPAGHTGQVQDRQVFARGLIEAQKHFLHSF